MPKITISSTRVYYHELSNDTALAIQNDISLYQSMLHKSYRELYHNNSINSRYLKDIYHTNDYFPLSAISEAKGILKSQKTWHHKSISMKKKKLKKIEKKIDQETKFLKQYKMTKATLVALSKAITRGEALPPVYRCRDMKWYSRDPLHCYYRNQYMLLYIFEVQHLNQLMKATRHRIRMLKYRKTRMEHKIEKLEKRMKQIRFHRNRYMKITGRSQGRYCNNLFKYDHEKKTMTYIDTHQRRLAFSLDFPYRKEELIRVLNLKHATKGKAVCYTLKDKGDYFIVSAAIELDVKYEECLFEITEGTVGIDINNDRISLSEIDRQGNLIYCRDILFDLSSKTSSQRKWIIENTVKQVIGYCREVGKPLIIEELNFEKKKKDFELYNQNKQYQRMLSEFSYRKIIEKLYSRSYRERIGINEVNPAYTSVIGKLKYARQKGISIHKAASYVIARRGMGYSERLPLRKYQQINRPQLTRWRNYSQLIAD